MRYITGDETLGLAHKPIITGLKANVAENGLALVQSKFVIEGNYKYTFNNGAIAMADTKAAAMNFFHAMEKIPGMIEQYQEKNFMLEKELPVLQEMAGKVWKKEDELKLLKSEAATWDRKIQLKFSPPAQDVQPEETLNITEHEQNKNTLNTTNANLDFTNESISTYYPIVKGIEL